MKPDLTEAAARHALAGMLEASKQSRRGATIAALGFLDAHGAGVPDVDVFLDNVRDDARFWASTAHQVELEVYMVAAIMALEDSPLTARAAKRIAALGFKRMSPGEREKFKEWMDKQDDGHG